jgi:hypothetical protein
MIYSNDFVVWQHFKFRREELELVYDKDKACMKSAAFKARSRLLT